MSKLESIYREIENIVVMEQLISSKELKLEFVDNTISFKAKMRAVDDIYTGYVLYFKIHYAANLFGFTIFPYLIRDKMAELYGYENICNEKEDLLNMIKHFFSLGVFK